MLDGARLPTLDLTVIALPPSSLARPFEEFRSMPVAAPPAPSQPAEIVITGRLLPTGGERVFAPVVVDRERLTLNASGRIEDVLADVAGFQSFRRADSRASNPTAQGAVLRGLGGNASARVLVLLDGVPQGDPFFGSIAFNALVPGELRSARVTRGAGAGPFGLGGVAGVVELESVGAEDLATASGSLAVGSRESFDTQAILAPSWDGGFAVVAGRAQHGAGFWTTPPEQRVAASVRSAYDDQTLSGRIVDRLGAGELQASARLFEDQRVLRFRGADNSSSGRDAALRWVKRGRWSLDALGYYQKRDFTTLVVSATSLRPTLNQRATPSTGLGGRVEVRSPEWNHFSLRAGGDVRHAVGTALEDSLARSGAVTASREAGGHQFDAGAYGELDWARGPVALTAGGRVDRWRQTHGLLLATTPTGAVTSEVHPAAASGWLPSGRAGARVQLSAPVALRVAAYASARLPTLNELYRNFTVFPVTTLANPALKPERLRGAEAGVDLTPFPNLTVTATVFSDRLADAIANVTIGPNLRRRDNVAAIVSRGAEIEGRWSFPHGNVTASWTHYRARLETSDVLNGKRPAQTPNSAASATLTLKPLAVLDLSGTVRRTGRAYEDDLNIDPLPAATTADAVVRWRFAPQMAVELRGENLGNARVVTRNQAGSIDLGMPRTLWIALVAG